MDGLSSEDNMAEREGFEPSKENNPLTRLAGERLRPLGHLSVFEFFEGIDYTSMKKNIELSQDFKL